MHLRPLLALCVLPVAPVTLWSQGQPDWSKNRDEVVATLQGLIRINTSNPPGNETQAVRYLQALLEREGIPTEVFAKDSSRANLVARLKGTGKQRPILLMGHTDVVGVERDKWTVDPFAALIKDGYVYGRGASDDKDNAAVSLQVLLLLHRLKVPLDRDVIFLAEAGEEGTSEWGIEFMVDQHFDKIDAEFALLEGGGIQVEHGVVKYVAVSTTEKIPNTVRLVAHGTSGHASVPRPDNPIVHLAAAVAKIGAFQPPMRLNETTRAYFQRLATISAPEDAALYTHLDDPAVQEKLRTGKIQQNSMLRTSISPTVFQGGFRRNVIPGDAEATLDIRALQDEDMPAFFDRLRQVIDDPAVELIPPARTRPGSPPSRLDSDMFQALERAQQAVFPGSVTIPTMLTGATDGAQLRAKGVQAYGIGNYVEDGDSRAHGNDERASIEGLGKFLQYLYTAVVNVAAAR